MIIDRQKFENNYEYMNINDEWKIDNYFQFVVFLF